MTLRVTGLVLAGFFLLSAAVPLAAAATNPPPGDGPWVVRATFTDRDQVNRLAGEREPWEVDYDQRTIVIDVDRAGWQALVDLGFVPVVDEERTERLRHPATRLPGQVEGIPGFPCYRTVEETYASAQAIVTNHPTLASWTDIGDSWEKLTPGGLPGYDMMVLKLTNSAIPGPKPKLIINAAIHAREYTTAELVTRFGEYLVNSYGTDADATWILDNQEVHLVLQANPDGRKKAEAGILWRKNTDNNDGCSDPNAWGTDLNRNYPYNWGCCGGSSGSACSETYRGPSAASEPETQAVRDYVLAEIPDYGDPQGGPIPADAAGMFMDIHSYSQLVLWPWGYTTTVAPNGVQMQTLGRKFAYFNNYFPEQSIYLYVTDGTTIDFAYGDRGVAAYTFELGTDFFQQCSYFENVIVPGNMPALVYSARVTRAPYMLPAGPESLNVATVPSGTVPTGQPVVVNASVNDTRFSNVNGTEPVQNIAAAEVYVDTPPWSPGAAPIALAAADGSFNQTVEAVTGTLDTTAWPLGRHTLYVRGKDALDNWGPVGAVFIDVVVPVELIGFAVE
jgi:murein tripeptide amidase MpaA